jgi:fibronectin-binding autotransporter adhesin
VPNGQSATFDGGIATVQAAVDTAPLIQIATRELLVVAAGGSANVVGADGFAPQTIQNNGTLTVNRSAPTTLAASLSGTGALVQAGAGQLLYTGTGSVGSASATGAGPLTVAAGGSLTMSGDLSVAAGARADAQGSGVFRVGGNLTNSGTVAGLTSVGGTLTNQPAGSVRVTAGQHLPFFGTAAHANAGVIDVVAGWSSSTARSRTRRPPGWSSPATPACGSTRA